MTYKRRVYTIAFLAMVITQVVIADGIGGYGSGGAELFRSSYAPEQPDAQSEYIGLVGKYVEVGQVGYLGLTSSKHGVVLNETEQLILLDVDEWFEGSNPQWISKGSLQYIQVQDDKSGAMVNNALQIALVIACIILIGFFVVIIGEAVVDEIKERRQKRRK